jgi:hypothetical protein
MENEVRVALNKKFTVYLRNRGNFFYVHRIEHEEISGYSFRDTLDENNELMENIHHAFSRFWNFDYEYTVNHLIPHTNMKVSEYVKSITTRWNYRYL